MLRRLLYALPLVAALVASAQTTTTITASNIVDLSGQPLAAGYLQLTPFGAAGHPIAFEANGKQYGMLAKKWAVTNGVAATITIPDTAGTFPGIGYDVQVLDNASPIPHVIASYPQLIFPTGSTWSFDAWQPGSTPVAYASGSLVAFGNSVPPHCSGSSTGYTNDGTAYYCIGGIYVAAAGLGGAEADWTAGSGPSVILHKPSLAAVATSGAYSDLSGKPSIPAAQVNSDWSSVSGLSQILNKPSIPAAVTIDGATGAFTFAGGGVSHTGNAYTFSNSGGMVYPAGAGFPVVVGGASWGTTLAVPSGFANEDATSSVQAQLNGKQASLGFTAVPNTRQINSHAISTDLTLAFTDFAGAISHAQLPTLLSGDIPANAANTSGTSSNVSGTPALPNGTTATTQTSADNTTKLATDAFVQAVLSGAGGLPTLPTAGTVPYTLISTPSGGVGGAAAWSLAGIAGRSVTTTTDTIAATDRGASVTYNNASAIAVALTSAATLGNNFDFVTGNLGAGSVTFTPGAGTINGASTLVVAQNESCAINSQDNTNYVARCGYSTAPGTLGSATATQLLVSGISDGQAPVTVTTGTTATLGGTYRSGYTFNQEATAATAVAYTLPTAAAGRQYCVGNSYNGSAATTGVLTINASASGQFIIFTDGTLSATGGNVTSGGAAADAACFVGVDATHWQIYTQRGTWTKH